MMDGAGNKYSVIGYQHKIQCRASWGNAPWREESFTPAGCDSQRRSASTHVIGCRVCPHAAPLLSHTSRILSSLCVCVCVCACVCVLGRPNGEEREGGNGKQFFSVGTDVAILWEQVGGGGGKRGRKCASPAKKEGSSIWRRSAASAESWWHSQKFGLLHRNVWGQLIWQAHTHTHTHTHTEQADCADSKEALPLSLSVAALPRLRGGLAVYLRDWLVRHLGVCVCVCVCVCVWQWVTDGGSWLQAALARLCHTHCDSQLCCTDR